MTCGQSLRVARMTSHPASRKVGSCTRAPQPAPTIAILAIFPPPGSSFAVGIVMNRHRPDLIVPIKDRRQRKRYLTLKNFGWFMLAAVVIFIGITIRSEMRGRSSGDY